MITLSVKNYCEDCSQFEARVTKLESFTNCMTEVTCEHAEKCEMIRKYLEKVNKHWEKINGYRNENRL